MFCNSAATKPSVQILEVAQISFVENALEPETSSDWGYAVIYASSL